MPSKPSVAIVMGSQSDWATMKHAADTLDSLGITLDDRIVSAHRTPDRLVEFAKGAKAEGVKVIIAGAGGAAHLPVMIASLTTRPVFGVPVQSTALSGQDSLLSIVQMPAGIPVGTLAIGDAGATTAALLAASVLALNDSKLDAPHTTVAAYDDEAALAAFAAAVDVVTYEFENVPAATAEFLGKLKPLRPGANALAVSQDRLEEKRFIGDLGIPVAAPRAPKPVRPSTILLRTRSCSMHWCRSLERSRSSLPEDSTAKPRPSIRPRTSIATASSPPCRFRPRSAKQPRR